MKTSNIPRKILSFIMAMVILPVAGITANAVSVKVVRDAAYTTMYGTYSTPSLITMSNVQVPFAQTWGISFNVTCANNTLVNGSCLPYNTGCYNTPPQCGTTCTNANTTPNHHKNLFYNMLNYNANNNWSSYDMLIILSGAQLCFNQSGVGHTTGILGGTYRNASYCTAENNNYQSNYAIRNVRIVQHELSHCFGCHDINDVACTPGQPCIMSGGFDNDSYFSDDNCIWCNAHYAEFNPNQH